MCEDNLHPDQRLCNCRCGKTLLAHDATPEFPLRETSSWGTLFGWLVQFHRGVKHYVPACRRCYEGTVTRKKVYNTPNALGYADAVAYCAMGRGNVRRAA